MVSPQVARAVRTSRVLAAEQASWYAPALFHARIVVTDHCPALAAIDDGWRVYFNPTMVQAMIDSEPWEDVLRQLGFVWIHEISHVLRDHGSRFLALQGTTAGASDPLGEDLPDSAAALAKSQKMWNRAQEAYPHLSHGTLSALALRWNLAADCEINDLEGLGLLQPPKRFQPVTPASLGMPPQKIAEYYYLHLPVVEAVRLAGNRRLSEGSGVDGVARPWELPRDDPQAAALSELDRKQLRQEVAKAVLAEAGKAGRSVENLVRWASDLVTPRVDWRILLRRGVRLALHRGSGSQQDYSYQRPHRRSATYAPLARPSLVSRALPSVACVVDTSGSMTPAELGRSLSEVHAVLRLLGTSVTIIPCDQVAYSPIRVVSRSDVERLKSGLPGGGGTNLVVGIEAALALRPAPDIVLVLTDGYTQYPEKRYNVPVFFGIFVNGLAGKLPNHAKPPGPVWGPKDYILIRE